MILDKIAAATQTRIEKEKNILPLSALRRQIEASCSDTQKASFAASLSAPPRTNLKLNFICEVKKASPSRGIIAPDFPYSRIARDYEDAGAAAISVLTEPDFFLGSNTYLKEISQTVSLPVLKKDFIIDEYQIYRARFDGASAVLLICALLDAITLKDFLQTAQSLSLDALVEAHDGGEIKKALDAGARIIGVNNRNLQTFTVDINTCIKLRPLVPSDKTFVAESGIKTPADIDSLVQANVNAVLIGEAAMLAADKKLFLRRLSGEK